MMGRRNKVTPYEIHMVDRHHYFSFRPGERRWWKDRENRMERRAVKKRLQHIAKIVGR